LNFKGPHWNLLANGEWATANFKPCTDITITIKYYYTKILKSRHNISEICSCSSIISWVSKSSLIAGVLVFTFLQLKAAIFIFCLFNLFCTIIDLFDTLFPKKRILFVVCFYIMSVHGLTSVYNTSYYFIVFNFTDIGYLNSNYIYWEKLVQISRI
jgi:hypothetical protein